LDHTVVHFEIPANEPEKLSEFYKNLFGWKFEKVKMQANNPSGQMDYWMIETRAGTAQNAEKAMSTAGVNGGMMKRMDANQHVTNYIMVESVDDFAKKAQQLGGKIIVPKTPIPDMGAFAVALDPEGNPFGIFETA
jgi:predicted enzyme related to lactoylglutathione lyase